MAKVALNQKDVSVHIRMLDDADGTPATGIVAATAGHSIWYQRGYDNAVVTDGGSAADHTNLTDAHTDWEFKHVSDGYYRVDFPDAAFAEGVGSVLVGMDATGYTGLAVRVDIEPLLKFQGQAAAVTATTTEFPAGVVVKKNDLIYVVEGTGIGQMRMITDVTLQVATHPAWDTNISATTSTIILIPHDNKVDVQEFNSVEVTGDGSAGDKWGA